MAHGPSLPNDGLKGEDLAAFRGERLVFRNISFTLKPGGALILAGPNGTGKSSLIRLIAGFTPLAAGRLLWDGADALEDPPLHARRLCFVGHLDAVKPGLSVADNLRLSMGADSEGIEQALDSVDLARFAPLPARLLSAGQKRRLALARLALTVAPLWLLDEPTTGLDAASVARLEARFAAHRAKGGMIVAATHLPLSMPEADLFSLTPRA